MTGDTVVGPSLPRMFLTLALGGLGVAAGLFLTCELSWVTIGACR